MKKLILVVCGAAALAFAAVSWGDSVTNYFDPASPPDNHHVHDCTLPPSQCKYPHLSVSFFPAILHESTAEYLEHPAECNDASDKSLLPPNDVNDTGTDPPTRNQPWRAGVCYTETQVIHLRSIDADDPAPGGWSGPIAPVTLGNGVKYVTYWSVTSR